MTIHFESDGWKKGTTMIGESHINVYKWRIFVAEHLKILNEIEYVEYLLPPTFSQPDRRIGDEQRSKGFPLEMEGYGKFINIFITVKFKDRHEESQWYLIDFTKLKPEKKYPF